MFAGQRQLPLQSPPGPAPASVLPNRVASFPSVGEKLPCSLRVGISGAPRQPPLLPARGQVSPGPHTADPRADRADGEGSPRPVPRCTSCLLTLSASEIRPPRSRSLRRGSWDLNPKQVKFPPRCARAQEGRSHSRPRPRGTLARAPWERSALANSRERLPAKDPVRRSPVLSVSFHWCLWPEGGASLGKESDETTEVSKAQGPAG